MFLWGGSASEVDEDAVSSGRQSTRGVLGFRVLLLGSGVASIRCPLLTCKVLRVAQKAANQKAGASILTWV